MFNAIIKYNSSAKSREFKDNARFDSIEDADKYVLERKAQLEFHNWNVVKSEIIEV